MQGTHGLLVFAIAATRRAFLIIAVEISILHSFKNNLTNLNFKVGLFKTMLSKTSSLEGGLDVSILFRSFISEPRPLGPTRNESGLGLTPPPLPQARRLPIHGRPARGAAAAAAAAAADEWRHGT